MINEELETYELKMYLFDMPINLLLNHISYYFELEMFLFIEDTVEIIFGLVEVV